MEDPSRKYVENEEIHSFWRVGEFIILKEWGESAIFAGEWGNSLSLYSWGDFLKAETPSLLLLGIFLITEERAAPGFAQVSKLFIR